MIIIEGMDNTGKSTLLERLMAMDPRLHVLKRPRVNPHTDDNIGDSYAKMLEIPDVAWGIADRFLVSECIYGTLFRQGCRVSIPQHQALLDQLLAIGTITIHAKPPLERVLATWKEREQLYEKPEALYVAYAEYMPMMFGAFLREFDYTQHDDLYLHMLLIEHNDLVTSRNLCINPHD